MAETLDLNRNTPTQPLDTTVKPEGEESAKTHRRVEREADKLAERGNERQRDDDSREFSNVGPV
ncbi:MAG TPA: hypothetical protein VFN62_05045 [Acidobacteriaceae bacterium]|nr:hypothetical protein [Acidobacteriaceae bacterium]